MPRIDWLRRAVPFLLAWLPVACNCGDTKLLEQRPKLEFSPSALQKTALCAPEDEVITVSNSGTAPLVVQHVSLEGSGWTLAPVTVPFTLGRHESKGLTVRATATGTATLHLATNDPSLSMVAIPLEAHLNESPTVSITSPMQGGILDAGADVMLQANVNDDIDAPQNLKIAWNSDTSGPISQTRASPMGLAEADWPASARMGGTQTVTLQVMDSCGAVSSASVKICQDGTYAVDPYHLQGWQYEGGAAWDMTNQWLLITPADTAREGGAFETSQIVGGDHVAIDFQFYVGGGTGADGFALVALDKTRMTSWLGQDGCGIGYGGDASCADGPGLPGWGIEVDTYYNSEVDQTQQEHVAFAFDGSLRTQPAWAALPEIREQWHTMSVNVQAPHVTVSIDNVAYIDQDVSGNFNFPAYVGFTGSTGGLTDEHRIKSLSVTGHLCQMM